MLAKLILDVTTVSSVSINPGGKSGKIIIKDSIEKIAIGIIDLAKFIFFQMF